MRPTAATVTPAALAVPTGVLQLLPVWAVLTVIGIGMLLASVQVIITQIIRLRASKKITSSRDALRALEIEDLPRGQLRSRTGRRAEHAKDPSRL
jgi:hypothetical protein